MFALNKTAMLAILICSATITGCAAATTMPPAPTLPVTQPTPAATISFEIVAQGAPFVSKGEAPSTHAIRGDDPNKSVPNNLPDDAKAALQNAISTPDSSLYLIINGGRQPSGGYSVRINSITMRDNQLVVNYAVAGPKPGEGAATVLTYPFAIVRVKNVSTPASAVVFEKQ